MMIVTGAAGFIGSCLISKLNQENFNYIIAADCFDHPEKEHNLYQKKIFERVSYPQLFQWLDQHYPEVEFVFHLESHSYHPDLEEITSNNLNVNFNETIWHKCTDYQIPLIFTSYMNSHKGYLPSQTFEHWAKSQEKHPFFWAGLQLPEVYGPNEYYKGEDASVVYRKYQQWKKAGTGKEIVPENKAPQALLYVKDVLEVCYYLMHHRKDPGIYELGTKQLYTQQEIVQALITSATSGEKMNDRTSDILPGTIRQAPAGYPKTLTSLEEGIADYVHHYLKKGIYL